MKNNFSGSLASSMDNVLKSAEFKSMFNKTASFHEADDHLTHDHTDDCDCDDAHSAKDKDSEKEVDEECFEATLVFTVKDGDSFKQKTLHLKEESLEDLKDKVKESLESDEDEDDAHDFGLTPATAYDVALDSLLTASAALDEVNLEKNSSVALRLAGLVVEAKKAAAKDKEEKKSKKEKEEDKSKSSKKTSKKDKEEENLKSKKQPKKDEKEKDKKSKK